MSNFKRPEWGRSQTNALELLHQSGWGWGGIAAHVSAIGPARSIDACKSRARNIALSRPHNGHPLERLSYDDDLLDMMLLDYSTGRMAKELTIQYGKPFTQRWAYARIVRLPGFTQWRRRADDRRARGVSVARRKAA